MTSLTAQLQAAEAGSHTCRSCRFYGEKENVTGRVTGECRRRAPQQFYGEGWCHNGWPSVEENDWCGEFANVEGGEEGGS